MAELFVDHIYLTYLIKDKVMRKATLDSYRTMTDVLKIRHGRLLTNIFIDINKIKALLQNKKCLFYSTNDSLIIMIPYHNHYYDCLFQSASLVALERDITECMDVYQGKLCLRFSIIGKEPQTGGIAALIEKCGFKLGKKLARMIPKKLVDEKVMHAWASLGDRNDRNDRNDDNEDNEIKAEFAKPEDAKEILDLLLAEFDILADNLPELESIVENIKKKQVIIVKLNDKIAAFHYFAIENNIRSGIYDVTHKDFRNYNLQNIIYDFLMLNVNCKRIYSWRDTANKRLLKYSKLLGSEPDGVYIYNMIWAPGQEGSFPND
jgi:hypothetical protein